MVLHIAWKDLAGFGHPHPGQKTPFKPEHPGLVLYPEPPFGNTVILAPGSSKRGKSRDSDCFTTSVKLVRENPFTRPSESYFFPRERRTVWRNPHYFSYHPHFGDLPQKECERWKKVVQQCAREDYFPDV